MTILKENIPILEEVNLSEWHKHDYNGKGVSVVLLDDGGLPREHMKSYYFNIGKDKGSVGHSTNVGYSAHTSALNSKIIALNAKSNFDESFEWLKNNKDKYDIINISLAGIGGSTTPKYEKLRELNKIILCASGNDAYEDKISYPANYYFTISIGAWSWKQDSIHGYSNSSSNLDALSNSGIYMLRDDGYIWSIQGTSFSSPFACGQLACYIQWRNEHDLPKLTPEEAKQFIHSNCVDIEKTERDGHGLFVMPDLKTLEKTLIINKPIEEPKQPEIIINPPSPIEEPEKPKEEVKNMLVCLDPGHNSPPNADTGCQGFGLREEDITLDICKRAKPLIESNGINVIMTREGNCVSGGQNSLNASLSARVKISDNSKANLFLSVHCNAFNSSAYGSESHVFGLGGNAERFAKILQPKMGKLFYQRGIKVSNFQVIRDTDASACLLETAFLDNKSDNKKLADPNIRQQIAVNIAESVCEYFGVQFKQPSPQFPTPSPSNVMFRIIIDGKQISALSNQESAIAKMKEFIDGGKGKLGIIQRNTDSVNVFEYSKQQPIARSGKIIIWVYSDDSRVAKFYADFIGVKAIDVKEMTQDMWESYENIVQIGGKRYNSNVTLVLSGNDAFDTIVEVLRYMWNK